MRSIRTITTALVAGIVAASALAIPAQKDIVDTAVSIGKFKTLASLATEADLVGVLKSEGPFTVFAPNDNAFAAVPKPIVDALLADKELLKQVLLYHVVPGKVMASDLSAGHVKMANGENANVKLGREGEAKINQAVILLTDVGATNGVIHVINNVIVPPSVLKVLRDRGVIH